MIEADRVNRLQCEVVVVDTQSQIGKGPADLAVPNLRCAVGDNYSGAGEALRFVRVGSGTNTARFPPDIHIYTGTNHTMATLPADIPAEIEYYRA